MDDRKLLELAAKAAGMEMGEAQEKQWFYSEDGQCGEGVYRIDGNLLDYWSPLTDDGDALRLAVSLHIDILHRFVGGQRVEALAPGGPLIFELCNDQSRQDATRRAIVRAAAAIGEQMP